jgi:hypothetical protein
MVTSAESTLATEEAQRNAAQAALEAATEGLLLLE